MMTLIFALVFNVTVQQCIDDVCVEICQGSISSAPTMLTVYRVNCADEVFKDGFD